jgi:hypothetical protein
MPRPASIPPAPVPPSQTTVLTAPPPISQPQPNLSLAQPSPLPPQQQQHTYDSSTSASNGSSPLPPLIRTTQAHYHPGVVAKATPDEQGQRSSQSQNQQSAPAPQLPSSLGDLVASFESAKQKGACVTSVVGESLS